MERYTEEQFFADLKRREEREAKEEQERRERVEKEAARQRWLADGGTESAFAAAWPQLRDEGRRRRVLDAEQRAREAARRRATSNF